MKSIINLLIIVLVLPIFASNQRVDYSKISYEIFKTEDTSVGGRERVTIYITSNANSFDERIFIIMKAATDFHKISSARTIYAWLSMSKKLELKSHIGSLQLARAFYAPDGQGGSALGDENWTWNDVSACEEKINPSDVEKLEKYWELRDELKNSKKNLSSSRIESIVSKKMNMSEIETANLTYKEMKDFTVANM